MLPWKISILNMPSPIQHKNKTNTTTNQLTHQQLRKDHMKRGLYNLMTGQVFKPRTTNFTLQRDIGANQLLNIYIHYQIMTQLGVYKSSNNMLRVMIHATKEKKKRYADTNFQKNMRLKVKPSSCTRKKKENTLFKSSQ